MNRRVPVVTGGKSIPNVSDVRERSACCSCSCLTRGEWFAHSSEVRIVVTCANCFDEEARVFHMFAEPQTRDDLRSLLGDYIRRPPFAKQKTVDEARRAGFPTDTAKAVTLKIGYRWVSADKLRTGDVCKDLGEPIVIVTTAQNANGTWRIRYRSVDGSYKTRELFNGAELQVTGNEYDKPLLSTTIE